MKLIQFNKNVLQVLKNTHTMYCWLLLQIYPRNFKFAFVLQRHIYIIYVLNHDSILTGYHEDVCVFDNSCIPSAVWAVPV